MTAQNLQTIGVPFLTILFLLLVGAGMRRLGLVNQAGIRQMSGLVLNVALPALIWVTLASEVTREDLGRAPMLAAMGVIGAVVGYTISAAIGRLPLFRAEQRATFQTAVAVTNTGFIGYPLCHALLGSKGLLYAVLYDVGLTAVMSTYSIWLLDRASRRQEGSVGGPWRDLLRTPMMWGLVLGALWGGLRWPTPDWFLRPLQTLAQCTTPLALLTVGMLIQIGPGRERVGETEGRPHRLRWQLAALAIARLLLAPALLWALVVLLRVERTAAAVIVLQTAMPSAVCTTAMVEQYGGDSAFAAAGVISTTLLSLVTLPLWSGMMLG